MSGTPVVTETHLSELPLLGRGKVRDIYDLQDHLLIVASDRISAFDWVLPNGIPDKGRVLTALSIFWFDLLKDITPTHFVTADLEQMGHGLAAHADILAGRTMMVHKTEPVPVECVVRGYLAGSGWREYQADGTVCGAELPAGLLEASQLPEPIFTPAIKAKSGHDENVSFDRAAELIGADLAAALRDRSIALYQKASVHARDRGIIIADTKFEWGILDGEVILIDEAFTPDSSRFWPQDRYSPGGSQPSFDKQPVRDWLESSGWDKNSPPPTLPDDVVQQTTARYVEALRLLTA
ncbi:MAG: phosphoribosylaminoimidazolesuccinocarboxamide synthase [Candidatus Brocadiae bacterium]|nr:phosphoribosylaminoimidazolesuccinocarboxamide synthase [Candidatus Brocadiia bacterium]